MKVILFTGRIVVNEKHPNAPTENDVKLGIENALETPDNNQFGITLVRVDVRSYIMPIDKV